MKRSITNFAMLGKSERFSTNTHAHTHTHERTRTSAHTCRRRATRTCTPFASTRQSTFECQSKRKQDD